MEENNTNVAGQQPVSQDISNQTTPTKNRKPLLFGAIALAVLLVALGAWTLLKPEAKRTDYVIGVSNTLVGNGWRDQMICSIKAEARASGVVSQVIVKNENGDAVQQSKQLEELIAADVDAIIVNPADREGLNAVIEKAVEQGIVVVAVDQAVTAENAYVVTNDQAAYAKNGATWLFEQLDGVGKVVEMRGIEGVPADTDRHNGFLAALEQYPGVELVATTFTGWDFETGAEQALELATTQVFDGIWTSGIEYRTIEEFKKEGIEIPPIVGADNNGFIKQMLDDESLVGAAVTNPPAIGAVGASIAISALMGEEPQRVTTLNPEVIDNTQRARLAELYVEGENPGWSTFVDIAPYTSYNGSVDVPACLGPGE